MIANIFLGAAIGIALLFTVAERDVDRQRTDLTALALLALLTVAANTVF